MSTTPTPSPPSIDLHQLTRQTAQLKTTICQQIDEYFELIKVQVGVGTKQPQQAPPPPRLEEEAKQEVAVVLEESTMTTANQNSSDINTKGPQDGDTFDGIFSQGLLVEEELLDLQIWSKETAETAPKSKTKSESKVSSSPPELKRKQSKDVAPPSGPPPSRPHKIKLRRKPLAERLRSPEVKKVVLVPETKDLPVVPVVATADTLTVEPEISKSESGVTSPEMMPPKATTPVPPAQSVTPEPPKKSPKKPQPAKQPTPTRTPTPPPPVEPKPSTSDNAPSVTTTTSTAAPPPRKRTKKLPKKRVSVSFKRRLKSKVVTNTAIEELMNDEEDEDEAEEKSASEDSEPEAEPTPASPSPKSPPRRRSYSSDDSNSDCRRPPSAAARRSPSRSPSRSRSRSPPPNRTTNRSRSRSPRPVARSRSWSPRPSYSRSRSRSCSRSRSRTPFISRSRSRSPPPRRRHSRSRSRSRSRHRHRRRSRSPSPYSSSSSTTSSFDSSDEEQFNYWKPSSPMVVTKYVTCFKRTCLRNFRKRYQLDRHMDREHHRPMYKCPVNRCPNKMDTRKDFKKHLFQKHRRVKIWRCGLCADLVPGSGEIHGSIYIHYVLKHQPGRYCCGLEGCSYEANYHCDVIEHYHMYHLHHRRTTETTKFRVTALKCPECPEWFLKPITLDSHRDSVHGILWFQCPVVGCRESFRTKAELTVHSATKHADITVWKCPKCPRSFSEGATLNTHHYLEHSEGTFECTWCSYKGKCRAEIIDHWDDEHGGKKRR